MNTPEDHFRAFLESLGLDADDDPHLGRTPERVTKLLNELFAATSTAPPTMSVFDADGAQSLVCVASIPFRSMCVHHFLPFFGTLDVAYEPEASMAGFGSFGRVVEWASRRPQIQERLVTQVMEVLQDQLEPRGLLVRCRARQLCVEMTTGRTGTYLAVQSTGSLAADAPAFKAALDMLSREEAQL